MPHQITIIVGSQWGDEGKGKITDIFAKEHDYVVRFHGGNNAGHTLVANGKTYKLHLVPSGVLYPHTISIIGAGVLVDPKVLLEELHQLTEQGISPELKISERAHVILPYHIAMDEALSGHQAQLAAGSTKRGIAPVAADKAFRHGIRIGDLLEPEILREKLEKSLGFNQAILKKVFKQSVNFSLDNLVTEYLRYGEKLRPFITDTEVLLHTAYQENKHILFEGAQGMSLDPDHGAYPHTTSTNNVADYAAVGSGLRLNCEKRIIGVVKAYTSRVGSSPFPTELLDDTGEHICEKGYEYGTTTGRKRRIGWLDLVQVRQSVRTSGLSEIALTKIDVLGGLDEVLVCNSYDIDGEIHTEMPASLTKFRNAQPVYTSFKGWPDMSSAEWSEALQKGYEGLPETLRSFIEFIEKEVGCRVGIISYGPDREETFVR